MNTYSYPLSSFQMMGSGGYAVQQQYQQPPQIAQEYPRQTYTATGLSNQQHQVVPLSQYLTNDEIRAVGELRDVLRQEGYTDVPDDKIVAALMARKFEVPRGLVLLKNQLQWRKEHAHELIFDSGVMQELSAGKLITPPARALSGAQIVYFLPRFHNTNLSSPNDVFRMAYMLIERLLPSIETQRYGFLIIVDLAGVGYKNFDRKLPRVFVNQMQNRFPARLAQVLIVNPPRVFKMMYSAAAPFIPTKYLDKIRVTDIPSLRSYVSPDQLLVEYGGSMHFDREPLVRSVMEEYGVQQKAPMYTEVPSYAATISSGSAAF